MSQMNFLLTLIAVPAIVSGCATQDASPLFFGQGLTVGITAGAAPVNNTPEITVGVKMADVAIVPTVVPIEHKDVQSGDRKILANQGVKLKPSQNGVAAQFDEIDGQDALSTFGSFSSETKVNNVTLGVFFATGIAAANLSQGFQCSVGSSHKDCTSQTGIEGGADSGN